MPRGLHEGIALTEIPHPAAPAASRLVCLDALRGVAVLGIFMMNVQSFAMVREAYLNPAAHMDLTGANLAVWVVGHVFFELKFLTVFSVLFGAGLAMTVDPLDPDSLMRNVRRMGWLLLAGLIHAYVIWFGDILVFYAVCGLLAAMLVDRRPGALIAVGLALTGVTAFSFWSNYAAMADSAGFMPASWWRPSGAEIREATQIAAAPLAERVAQSAERTFETQLSGMVYHGPRILGCMLIGAALFRTGFLRGAWPAWRYSVGALVSLPVGLGLSALSARTLIAGDLHPQSMAWSVLLNHGGSLIAASGYACLVMLAVRPAALRLVLAPFAAAGRMAFTNYIAQSLIAAFLFFGPPGLGWFGEVERTGQLRIVLAVWAAQLIWSPLWLAVFRYGPLEWAWRSLTYMAVQPMLRSSRPAPAEGR